MKKNEILEGLSNAHHALLGAKEILKKITLSEIWDKETQNERDKTVQVLQAMEKQIIDLNEIEKCVLSKNHKDL